MHTCFQTTYNPNLMYHSGHEMPPRPKNLLVTDFDILSIDKIKTYERRVTDVIDLGVVTDVSAHSLAQLSCQNIFNIPTK